MRCSLSHCPAGGAGAEEAGSSAIVFRLFANAINPASITVPIAIGLLLAILGNIFATFIVLLLYSGVGISVNSGDSEDIVNNATG